MAEEHMRTNKVLGLAAALALIVALVSAGVVVAQTKRNATGVGRGFYAARAFNHIGQEIGLTDQQKQQIKDIVRSRKTDIKALIDQGFAARKALREAVAANDDDHIAAAVTQLSGVERKAAELKAQVRAKVFSDVLQPDQRAKADQLLSQFEQKADQRRQHIEEWLDRM